MEHRPALRSVRAIGTNAAVAVSEPWAADLAETLLLDELRALDAACSRFRPDSEIWRLYRSAGSPVLVSELLFDVVRAACAVAADTGGAVDPTVGGALEVLGYDRDFSLLGGDDASLETEPVPVPVPGWWTVELDEARHTIRLAPGVRLDVGSSAKAWAADRIASAVADRTGVGALVSLGGDVSIAGPVPAGGWPVGIAVDSATTLDEADVVVALSGGGMASSSPRTRAWTRGGRQVHHIVDPRTGDCASDHWRLVTVAAPTCGEANALSTAAVVWGPDAVGELVHRGHPARLVSHDGVVTALNGWPSDRAKPTTVPRTTG